MQYTIGLYSCVLVDRTVEIFVFFSFFFLVLKIIFFVVEVLCCCFSAHAPHYYSLCSAAVFCFQALRCFVVFVLTL